MGYNVKVIKYDSEIQVNFYEHGVRVTDKHFMTDAEKKELKEKNVEADISDDEQFSRMPAVAFEYRSELNKARSLSLIISRHLPLQALIVIIMIHVKRNSGSG